MTVFSESGRASGAGPMSYGLETKDLAFDQVATVGDDGRMEGYASLFGKSDQSGVVTLPQLLRSRVVAVLESSFGLGQRLLGPAQFKGCRARHLGVVEGLGVQSTGFIQTGVAHRG